MWCRRFAGAIFVLCLVVPVARSGPYQFVTIDSSLGPWTQILGLNNSGTASGYHLDTSTGYYTGLIFSGGKEQHIFAPGAIDTEFYQINNAGQIATSYFGTNLVYHAAVYNSASATWTFLPDVNGFAYNLAGGINNKGLVVGNVFNDTVNFTNAIGWTWDGSKYTLFQAPKADLTQGGTVTYSVNDAGQVVGVYYDSNGMGHGYLKTGSIFTTIDFPGASETDLYGINDAGVLSGRYLDAKGIATAFLWSNGVFTTVGDPDPAVVQTRAISAVNDNGEIAGWFLDAQGNIHAFAGFPPVPEPSSLALLALGGVALAGWRRWKKRSTVG